MTYTEFKRVYNWLLKKYYNVADTYGHNLKADCIIDNYVKSGNKWVKVDTNTVNNISNEHYYNTVDAVPFFRGLGGYEKVEVKATKWGYIPFRIVSITPNKTEKTVRTFIFN